MILTSCQVVICCCGEAMVSRDGDHDGRPKVGLGHKKSASRDAAKKKVSAEASRPENSPEPQKRSREARMSRNQKARNSSSSSRSPKARNSSSSSRRAKARNSPSSSRSAKARNSSSSSRSAKARNSSSSSRSPKARNSSSSSSSPKARSSSSSSRKAKRKRKPFLNSEHQRISCFWCFLILETSRYLSQHVLQLYFVPSLLLVVFHVLHFYKQTSSQLWPSFNFICCCLSFQLSVKTIFLVTKVSTTAGF